MDKFDKAKIALRKYILANEEKVKKDLDEMRKKSIGKDIRLKYVINKALGKYESYWVYREDKQSNIVEEVFKEIRENI